MFTKTFAALTLAATALAQLTINTPASLVQCQPALITFSGGTAPYILAAIPGEQTSAAAIETINGDVTGSPYTWNVNLASGTYLTLKITDATGNVQYSSALTIQAGSSNSCLNTSASTSGVATTGAITTTGSGSMTLSGTTSASAPSGSTTSLSRAAVSSSSSMSMSMSSGSMSASGSSAGASSSSGGIAASATSAAASAAASKTGAASLNMVAGIPAIGAGLFGAVLALL